MKTNPLDQLERICRQSLSRVAKLNKSFKKFLVETMICFLSIPGRINFSQMARYGSSCESRFRQNFKKKFEWTKFNTAFTGQSDGHLRAIAIDPCFIPKSGKKTPGLAYFWSGTANAAKRGLEILGMALVDACERTAVFLTATQTVTDRRPKGKKVPDYLAHLDNPDSLIGLYLRAFARESDRFWKLTHLVVADAFFANISFVTGLDRLAFDLVSRLRDDARLRYIYNGPKENRKGRPRKFDGTVDVDNPREDRFVVSTVDDGDTKVTLYHAKLYAVCLKRVVGVAIAVYDDKDKKTQTRKIFFSTDLSLNGEQIYSLYRSRFQIEFLYRDGKQFTGLTDCQARNENSLDFAFNASLTAVNIAKAFAKESGLNLSVESVKLLTHNAVVIQRVLSLSGIRPNLNLNQDNFKELLFYGVKSAA